MVLILTFTNDENESGRIEVYENVLAFSFLPKSTQLEEINQTALKRDIFHYILSFTLIELVERRILFDDDISILNPLEKLSAIALDKNIFNLVIKFKQPINSELFNSLLFSESFSRYRNQFISDESLIDISKIANEFFETKAISSAEISRIENDSNHCNRISIDYVDEEKELISSINLELQNDDVDFVRKLELFDSRLNKAKEKISDIKTLTFSSINMLKKIDHDFNFEEELEKCDQQLLNNVEDLSKLFELSSKKELNQFNKMSDILNQIKFNQESLLGGNQHEILNDNINKNAMNLTPNNVEPNKNTSSSPKIKLLISNLKDKKQTIPFASKVEHYIVLDAMRNDNHPDLPLYENALKNDMFNSDEEILKQLAIPIELFDEKAREVIEKYQPNIKNESVPLWSLTNTNNANTLQRHAPTGYYQWCFSMFGSLQNYLPSMPNVKINNPLYPYFKIKP